VNAEHLKKQALAAARAAIAKAEGTPGPADWILIPARM